MFAGLVITLDYLVIKQPLFAVVIGDSDLTELKEVVDLEELIFTVIKDELTSTLLPKQDCLQSRPILSGRDTEDFKI